MKTASRFPRIFWGLLSGLTLLFLPAGGFYPAPSAQGDNPNPPDQPVKLIFIHHSTGENWLEDGYGGLGIALGQNNYFVSDTNYGWGPNSIGDRTDIPNWMEWFRSGETPTYMNALFGESGQNSWYTRNQSDPGGENEIVMFKSCFPNSELEGNPTDAPGTYEDMTVSGAKYVYNQLLEYFEARPDKLFVVITAPPVSNPEYAANARAFNNWLVDDWLRENNYALNNVAVFDFYNVLTGPNNHHRFVNGGVEHVFDSGRNTLHYPSDDDHPSVAGSQKATQEFVPLLNVFYHRWRENAPLQPTPESATPVEEAPQPELYLAQPPSAGLIDDFETDTPLGTNGWEPFWDVATPTSMHCTAELGMAYAGNNSLILDFEVMPDTWATCALFYDNPQNWSAGEGIMFFYHAAQPGIYFDFNLYIESPDGRESYVHFLETTQASVDGWEQVRIPWSEFQRVDWEANPGAPFTQQAQVSGMAFGFGSEAVGMIWVDYLSLLRTEPVEAEPAPTQPAESPAEPVEPAEPPDGPRGRPRLCGGAVAAPFLLVGLSLWSRKRSR